MTGIRLRLLVHRQYAILKDFTNLRIGMMGEYRCVYPFIHRLTRAGQMAFVQFSLVYNISTHCKIKMKENVKEKQMTALEAEVYTPTIGRTVTWYKKCIKKRKK